MRFTAKLKSNGRLDPKLFTCGRLKGHSINYVTQKSDKDLDGCDTLWAWQYMRNVISFAKTILARDEIPDIVTSESKLLIKLL